MPRRRAQVHTARNERVHAQIAKWKKETPFSYEESKHIVPQEAVKALYELTKGDAIITTGVGQHQMWLRILPL